MAVLSVVETQDVSLAGVITDEYEVVYQVPGRDTVVTFKVPRTGDVIADAEAIRDQIVAEVNALYAL